MASPTESTIKEAQVASVEQDGEPSQQQRSLIPAEDATSISNLRPQISRTMSTNSQVQYKVYKRRFFGLAQLVLLNIVVSWSWIAFAPISTTAATYFNTSESIINWLSTAFLFAFVVATPPSLYALSQRGPKTSIVVAACFLFAGSWIKYGGTVVKNFGVVMFGQLLIGFAQPFVLAAPTTYSDVWFSESGRTKATALASLSNPFGAALGQLISPFWATSPSQIPNTVLYISIITSVASIPSFFIPKKPPSPPTASHTHTFQHFTTSTGALSKVPIKADVITAFSSLEFYLIFIPFSIYVGFFNAFSSLINQLLQPYGFSEDDAGIAGAILIVVGLISGAVSSLLIDRYKFYLNYVRVMVPVVGIMYLIFIWAPPTKSIPFIYVLCAILGAASFGLVPVILEFLVEILYPISPATSSAFCWSGGQLFGGIFIIVMDALKAGPIANPPANMTRALIFEAVIAMLVFPLPLCLGLFGRRGHVRLKRYEEEKQAQRNREQDVERDELDDGQEDEDGTRNSS